MPIIARLLGLLLSVAMLAAGPAAYATTFKTLHVFTGPDGAEPQAALVFDTKGALYGTTRLGGPPSSGGTVFKLNPATHVLTILHAFKNNPDGAFPVAGLVFDTKGALYGTTSEGGAHGGGIVFKLDPATHVLTRLHPFTGPEGSSPQAGLVFDTKGALYGTTVVGGPAQKGTVFKLDPATHVLTILNGFTNATGGVSPQGLVFDTNGALYGTTAVGPCKPVFPPVCGRGTVFKLDPATRILTTLHDFNGADGADPVAGLVFDTKGALYGTTSSGGAHGVGTVFTLNPATKVLTTLHTFTGAAGANPLAGLMFGPKGALFGMTSRGGASNEGTVFELAP